MKRVITIKLTKDEAEALLEAGIRGCLDFQDDGTEEALTTETYANWALGKIGSAINEAWPKKDQTNDS